MTRALQALTESDEIQQFVAEAHAQRKHVIVEVFQNRNGRPLLIQLPQGFNSLGGSILYLVPRRSHTRMSVVQPRRSSWICSMRLVPKPNFLSAISTQSGGGDSGQGSPRNA